MEKRTRNLITTVVMVALAIVFVSTSVHAGDGTIPTVGLQVKPFNQGDKVTFNMKDYSSMVVRFVAKDTSKTTQVEMWATTDSNNNQFQKRADIPVSIYTDHHTASFWTKSRGCDTGGSPCPKNQFRCKKNNCNKLKIMELK